MHAAYIDGRLTDQEKEKITALYQQGITQPSLVYSVLQSASRKNGLTRQISRQQIRFQLSQCTLYGQVRAALGRVEGESEVDEAARLSKQLLTLEVHKLAPEPAWDAVAWSLPSLASKTGDSKELLFDGTHGVTQTGWELVVGLAEQRLHSYPVAVLALRRSSKTDKLSTREVGKQRGRIMHRYFEMVQSLGFNPSVIHSDKDFGEITSAQAVWPDAHIQICLWHAERALDKRLRAAPNAQTTRYNVQEVQAVIPTADSSFAPANCVRTNRTLVNPLTPSQPPSNPHPTPSAAQLQAIGAVFAKRARAESVGAASARDAEDADDLLTRRLEAVKGVEDDLQWLNAHHRLLYEQGEDVQWMEDRAKEVRALRRKWESRLVAVGKGGQAADRARSKKKRKRQQLRTREEEED